MAKLLVLTACVAVATSAVNKEGQWIAERYGNNGKYIPTDEGKYVHVPNPYIHIHNPYAGGFGPYAHLEDPYKGAASQQEQYRLVVEPGKEIPWYRPGYYNNNGIKILHQKHNYNKDNYDFVFKTENSILASEKAHVTNPNTKDESIASSGFYQYIGPDGYLYRVDYTADENGYRPKTRRVSTEYSGKYELVKV